MCHDGGMTTVTPAATVMVVDDDDDMRALMGAFLSAHGFVVRLAANALELDSAFAQDGTVDVVVLDVMMPGENGLSVCRRLAAEPGPAVIMHSAMGDAADRIVGLEMGADAYLPKPCDPRELLAQVRAMVRRSRGDQRRAPAHALYGFAGWVLDPVKRVLIRPDQVETPLANREFMLLQAFLERPQVLLTRATLAGLVGDGASDTDGRLIESQISRLRRKLGSETDEIIRTHRRAGYIFLPAVTRP